MFLWGVSNLKCHEDLPSVLFVNVPVVKDTMSTRLVPFLSPFVYRSQYEGPSPPRS